MAKRGQVAMVHKKRQTEIHPVWRGIGCLMMIITPVMSYALASLLVPVVHATGRLPSQLFQHLLLPEWVFRVPVLAAVGRFLAGIDNFLALVILFFLVLIVLSFLVSLMYAAVFQVVGPKRYGPMDAPPSGQKTKQYKR